MSRPPYSPSRQSTASKTSRKMSLTEITTPTLDPYLHRRLSCTVDDTRPGSANVPNGASNVLPPIISLQARDPLYRTYRPSLNTEIHPLQLSQDNPTAPLHHILCRDHQQPRILSWPSPSSTPPTGSDAQETSERGGSAAQFPPRQVKRICQRRDNPTGGSYCPVDLRATHSAAARPSDPRQPDQQQRLPPPPPPPPPVIYDEKASRAVESPTTPPPPLHGFRVVPPESDVAKRNETAALEVRPSSRAFSNAVLGSDGSRPTEGAAQDGPLLHQSYPRTTGENTMSAEGTKQEARTPPYTFPGPVPRNQDARPMERLAPDVSQSQGSSGTRNDGTRSMEIPGIIGESRTPLEPSHEPNYVISLRQQPLAARACGFGDRDRRAVDPPPILQMTIDDPRSTPQEIKARLRYPYFVVHCELWNADEDHAETAMPEVNDRPHQRRLMGTVVASPFVGQDENDVEGCFFCFPDLSCRTSGSYRLRFVLLILDPTNMKPGDKSPFKAMAMSQVFRVFAAKDFPGMQESTPLTKALKAQGCLISVKKGNNRARPSHSRGENEDDDEGEEEEEGESQENPRKRQKK